MSEILCTFPGRYGDLIWALPTVREIAVHYGTQVDLQIAGEFASIAPLIEAQPYIHKVYPDPVWGLTPPAEWQAPQLAPGIEHIHVHHLGYRGWPAMPLAQTIYGQMLQELPDLAPLDLTAPWIVPPEWPYQTYFTIGFTEAHFELKYGLVRILYNELQRRRLLPRLGDVPTFLPVNLSYGGRWATEARRFAPGDAGGTYDWIESAQWIAGSGFFLGCNSALHVLACAVGKPVLMVEPMEARHNPIFYPYGKTDRVQLLLGNDGNPTYDARHTLDEIVKRLAE